MRDDMERLEKQSMALSINERRGEFRRVSFERKGQGLTRRIGDAADMVFTSQR